MLYKVFGVVVSLILGAIFGLHISKNIEDNVLYGLFWLLYVITYLTISIIIAVSIFYNILRQKTGPPGQRGPRGEAGEIGEEGTCQKDCQKTECKNKLVDAFINEINKLAGNPNPPIEFKNFFMKEKLKRICTSQQYDKTIRLKGADQTINYISNIIRDWAKLIYDSSGTGFVTDVGGEENYKWSGKNPFNEIEKYDIYYWNMDQLYRPIGVDICDNSAVNKSLPQKAKPLLYLIKSNYYGDAYNPHGRASFNVFNARPIYNKGLNKYFYPMGSVGIAENDSETSSGNYTGSYKKIDDMKIPNNKVGPSKLTGLVAGDVTPPNRFDKIWSSNGVGGDNASVWRPVPKQGYKCLGDVFVKGNQPPNRFKFRCVPEKCAVKASDRTHNGTYLWGNSDNGDVSVWQIDGANNRGIGNKTGESNYNLLRAIAARNGHHEGFFKIREECLKPGEPNFNIKDEGNWISNRWLGYPERNDKYSIFKYLSLVPEGIIQNKKTKLKYKFISTNKSPNNYFIQFYHETLHKWGNLETFGSQKITLNMTPNRDRVEQIWILEYSDPTKVKIKSQATNKYLGSYYHDKWALIHQQYDKNPSDVDIVTWRIRDTSTGDKKVPQK